MKVLIIGGVAAGTKAAAKLKRRNQNVDVTIITKANELSYAGCGLPYYVGDIIENRDDLIVNSPEKYSALTGVRVLTGREAVSLDSDSRTVAARNLLNGESETYSYDELIIAVGASAVLPKIEGISLHGVLKMRNPDDAEEIRSYIERVSAKKAVIIGAGFIGLEVADNLFEKGIQITVIDSADQILPGVLDSELADYVRRFLAKKGIRFITGVRVDRIVGADRAEGVSTSYGILDADIVVSAAGIRPNTDFLKNCGIEMDRGVIKTDAQLKTNLPHVYAAGDCAMVTNRITGMAQWSPMGSSANMEARTLAQLLTGMDKHYPGVLGTGVVKLPGLNCGRTGLGEMQAAKAGFNVETAVAVTDDKAHYYPDSSFFITKLIADKNTHKLLGAQVIGPGAVDKMIDIAVTGINLGARIEVFEYADYA